MTSDPDSADVKAAGGLVRRDGKLAVAHRPRYDDWSFPKGKLDPDELLPVAAVREVAEETGLMVRLGRPLAQQRYPISGGRLKTVHYWVARSLDDPDAVERYEPNDEIDRVRWFGYDAALDRLTYPHDRDTLREAKRLRKRTHAVVVLRHGHARSRKQWTGDDRRRPLHRNGRRQAEALPALLAAYGVSRVVTSSSRRCVETVHPAAAGLDLELRDDLSEEGATDASVRAVVADLVAGRADSVLCTHRPVLPRVFCALGVPDPQLAPGGLLVAHVRKGRVVATELHQG
jgi:8-oxo-dGTP diphosphatase